MRAAPATAAPAIVPAIAPAKAPAKAPAIVAPTITAPVTTATNPLNFSAQPTPAHGAAECDPLGSVEETPLVAQDVLIWERDEVSEEKDENEINCDDDDEDFLDD
jgi:hypothetical protein